MMVPPPPTTTTTTTRREKKNGGGYGEDLRRALLESRTADETERDVNLRMLMHLRARRPEFEETAEAFLREAREGDGGRLPKRVDVNGVEREMTMQEMEAVFFGGDIHGRLKKSNLPNERDVGLLSRNDVLQRGRGAMRKAKGLPNRRECVKFIGKKKNPLSVVARRGRLMNAATERRWNEFDAGETEFTSKCSDVYFGRRFECQRTIHAHRDACYCAVYNSKGDKWVTGSDDWLVKIWSARNGRLLASCRGHTEPITIVSICPRDYLIASGSIDKDVRTWKLETGEPVSVLRGHFLPITVVIFNPAKPWILASASQDGTMRLWHAYKHSGEQSAAVADVHAMVSEKNDNENANGNNNNDTNNPPEGQQQRRQQQNRGGRLPRTQLTQVITLSFNCDGTAVCGGTDTCHPSSSRLFCYDFDLSKIKEESRGEAPPLDSLSAYDLSDYNRKIDMLDPLQLVDHMSRVDVTKFSNTDARIFISGSADGYIMCWQLPPKPKSDDRIKLKKGNRMRDELLWRLWVKKSQCSLENKSPEVVQAVWTKDDKHVIVTFANSDPLDLPTVEFFQSHSGTPERNYEIITQTKKIVTLAPHPFDPQIFLTGSYDGHIMMWRIDGSISSSHDNNIMMPWRTGGSISSIRTFSPQFENADFQIVEMHWNPDGLSFVAADTKGNCYLFGIGDNKRYLTQKRQQYFSVEFIPESAIARDEHGVARVYQDRRADSVYGETLFEHYGFESEVLCDQMGDPYSVEFMDAFKKGENLENFFSAIPPNPSEREFEGAWNRLDGCQHSSSLQLMISHRYDESPGQFFIEDPILDNGDEANEPDDVERDPDITISDDEADDYENENDDFNVEPEDLAELEDSGNANDDDSDDDDWGTNNRRRTRRRRADNRARIEAARNRRRLRRSARRSYAESETDSEEEEVYESDLDEEDEDEDARPRTRRRRNNQQLSSESEEEEEEEEEEERKDAGEGEEHRSTRLTFVMGPVKRSEQCFSWLSREFQGYGCYVPQLGDSVMYIPQGHEEFFDALNDTVSYRVWDDKADVRFCEPCVVSNLRYIINASTGSTVTDAPNETICELMLRFADPRSANFGETFSLKLPRLSVPDFIVCMDRFIAARDKKWKANDQNVFCLWDWEIEDEQHPGCFGRWWHGEISSVVKNEGRWRGSPWNNLRITYSNQANESVTHCFWELFDAEDKVRWRRAAEARQRNRASDCLLGPALSTEVTRALTQKVEKLIANDRFLAYVTDASCDDVYLREAIGVNANYCKIVPLPMSLERIKRRLKGRYYRQIDAYKSDADLILSNATLFHGEGSGFEAVAKEIREELLKDIDENDFVADTHEIHLNFPSYGVIKREMKEDAKNEEEEKQEEKEEEKEEKEEEEREEETPTLSPPVTRTRRDGNTTEPTRRTTRASALTMADASVHPTRQRSSRRRNR